MRGPADNETERIAIQFHQPRRTGEAAVKNVQELVTEGQPTAPQQAPLDTATIRRQRSAGTPPTHRSQGRRTLHSHHDQAQPLHPGHKRRPARPVECKNRA